MSIGVNDSTHGCSQATLTGTSTSYLSTSNTHKTMITSKTDKSMNKHVPELHSPVTAGLFQVGVGKREAASHQHKVSTVYIKSALENISALHVPVLENAIFLVIFLLSVVLEYDVNAFKGVLGCGSHSILVQNVKLCKEPQVDYCSVNSLL